MGNGTLFAWCLAIAMGGFVMDIPIPILLFGLGLFGFAIVFWRVFGKVFGDIGNFCELLGNFGFPRMPGFIVFGILRPF
jgi:hypothetical protein